MMSVLTWRIGSHLHGTGAGGASVQERWRSIHARYPEQCKLDAAANYCKQSMSLLTVQRLI